MSRAAFQHLQRAYTTSTPRAPIDELISLAIPLVPTHGFSTSALVAASRLLPSSQSHSPNTGYTHHTINSLFPSAPPSSSRKRSLTREQLKADAGGEGPGLERLGPAKALLEGWLREGRKQMVKNVRDGGLKGDQAVREGLRARIRYNESVVAVLPEALGMLGATTASPLASVSALVPFPTPTGMLQHVAEIAQDLAKATGDESQGVAWYRTRARIGTLYGLTELHLLSPSLASLPPSERIEASLETLDRLIEGTESVDKKIKDVEDYGMFIIRSWMGIARSLI
ncbi:ubiquinone biosynthesis protein coq9 [Pseudohyphozyma bogoriensis]|nr:ubiquinone biosynthesis protein coq9 [Pseudohyphozyma bogoriensis]